MSRAGSVDGRSRAASHARNQLNSRRLNEQITGRRYTSAFGDYVCECGRRACVAPVRLSAEEFEQLRKRPGLFVVLPDHWSPEHERLLYAGTDVHVVETIGRP